MNLREAGWTNLNSTVGRKTGASAIDPQKINVTVSFIITIMVSMLQSQEVMKSSSFLSLW